MTSVVRRVSRQRHRLSSPRADPDPIAVATWAADEAAKTVRRNDPTAAQRHLLAV
jgi:hypothetical protein